ncbi:hypothetical protein EK21DRAFT_92515 [Setomelanomma holmii]|uniref:Uncharacterized protein n=1 Tax=Setomelanomma holmii TaxID=210430 RepID=A0A9P4LI91_9PLEO|nr:hypothetical protein EK21DRAFT_92515 [Setomelanomma holmii]
MERMKEYIGTLRGAWEDRLRHDREALEQASRNAEKLTTCRVKAQALGNYYISKQTARPPEHFLQAEVSLADDLDDLGHRNEIIMIRRAQQLDRRWTPKKSSTIALKFVAAGAAVGQLVAMVPCSVM